MTQRLQRVVRDLIGRALNWLLLRPTVLALVRGTPAVSWFIDADEIGRRLRLREQAVRVTAARNALAAYSDRAGAVKVHLGCGPRVLEGWLNADLEFDPNWRDDYPDPAQRGTRSDFVAVDITADGLPWPDASVDLIYHEDFIEHLSQRHAICLLAETFRVMKPGAVQRINTPDLSASMRERSRFELGLPGVYTDEWDRWHHLNVFTRDYLDEICRLIGFSGVDWNHKDGSPHPEMPNDYRPSEGSRFPEGNLFLDLTK